MLSIPKYSALENERRWLVCSTYLSELENQPFRRITDRYLDGGRLRIRLIENSSTALKEFKLCKKYGSISEVSEPITNIYLSEAEYDSFLSLSGADVCKRRYIQNFGGKRFSVDVFEGHLQGLVLCETEMGDASELQNISDPPIAIREITADERFQGGVLSRMGNLEIYQLLKEANLNREGVLT